MYFHSIIWDFRDNDLNPWTFVFSIWNTIAVRDSSYYSNANSSWIPTYSFHWSTEFYFSNRVLHISIWTSHCFPTSISSIMEFIIFSSLEISFPFLFLFIISLSSVPQAWNFSHLLFFPQDFVELSITKSIFLYIPSFSVKLLPS